METYVTVRRVHHSGNILFYDLHQKTKHNIFDWTSTSLFQFLIEKVPPCFKNVFLCAVPTGHAPGRHNTAWTPALLYTTTLQIPLPGYGNSLFCLFWKQMVVYTLQLEYWTSCGTRKARVH